MPETTEGRVPHATVDHRDLLRETLRRFRRGLAVAAVFSLFISALQLTVPLYMLQVFDRVLGSGNLDTLAMLTVVAVGALAVFAVLEFMRARVFLVMGDTLARRLTLPTLQAAVSDTLNGRSRAAGEASRDLNELRTFLTGNAVGVPLDLLWSPLFLFVLFLLHPAFGFIALGSGAVLFAMSVIGDLATRRPLAEASDAAAESFGEVGGAVRNAEVIEAMGMLPAVGRRWQGAQDRMLRLLDGGNGKGKAIAAASRALRLCMQIAVLGTGALLVVERQATPGTIIAASIITSRYLQPFDRLIGTWRQWVFAHSAWRRVRGLLDTAADRRSGMTFPTPAGRLTADRVTFVPQGSDRPVLTGVSFALEPGEVLGVVGPSAAGKSTLARLLVGLWAPTAGGVYLDGHSVYLWDREDFGRHVGYLPQAVALLDGTVRENIARMADADPRAVVAAARRAGVHDMIGRLPFGYDTVLGDGGFALSGGQRQRIGLARALFGEPRFLVLDEPNSNLDGDGEQALLAALGDARSGGATIVLVAHRPSVMTIADKLLVLKEGRVDQFGERAEVLRRITGPAPVADEAAVGAAGNVSRLVPQRGQA
jgi:ATP-binding cassette subfamily C protein